MLFKVIIAFASVLLLVSPALSEEGAWNAADEYYDPEEMAKARRALQAGHGGGRLFYLEADRLEYQSHGGSPLILWDLQGWYGGDINKIWLKAEGEYVSDEGEFEEAELQVLYSRAVSPNFDVNVGLRHDLEPHPATTYGTLGLHGLAPYWFEVDFAGFISEDGDLTARLEAEYELLLTQRLIAQPRVELNLSAQDISALEIGAGLSTAELGLRVRYEIDRRFAPYLGVSWNTKVGRTARFARADGDDISNFSFVAGLRLWY